MSFADEKARQALCSSEALSAGLLASAKALIFSSLAVAAALRFAPGFRKATGTSSRTALVASPAFFFFFLGSEHHMTRCARRQHAAQAAGLAVR